MSSKYINHDSNKKLDLNHNSQKKKGNKEDGTEGAHKISLCIANVIETNTPGRPLGDAAMKILNDSLNSDSNIQIKTIEGNDKDDKHDAMIAQAYVNKTLLVDKGSINRVKIIYKTANNLGEPTKKIAEEIGKIKITDKSTNRPHFVKNHK
jgi:hypothetical protein